MRLFSFLRVEHAYPYSVYRFGRKPDYAGYDKWWKKHQYLRFSWRFRGRKRNCYRLSVRYVHKALMYHTLARRQKKLSAMKLWDDRLDAATFEHGFTRREFLEGLVRSHIKLNRQTLANLAIYEPRTFESLVNIAKTKIHQEGLASATTSLPTGVITRGML